MARIEFHGDGAGLGFQTKSGDRNELTNYVLFCSCGLELGPLSRFRPNDVGIATVGCERHGCARVLFVRVAPPPVAVVNVVPRALVEQRQRAVRLSRLDDVNLAAVGLLRTCGACADKTTRRERETRCKAVAVNLCKFCGVIIPIGDETAIFALPAVA